MAGTLRIRRQSKWSRTGGGRRGGTRTRSGGSPVVVPFRSTWGWVCGCMRRPKGLISSGVDPHHSIYHGRVVCTSVGRGVLDGYTGKAFFLKSEEGRS